ncbi:Mch5p [Sugiyamaella lignohabitans]|uniref:Mch5p n=1 Tax=Sugiyamaella lignohabitans TaxID=796027 RepID=A0A167FRE1_9ASCO|nr:Mch5p [Sugiyamaella lignohabitans]ANB15604.1 Mch5p [Sugiyamaella lignohabitans]
MQDSLSVSSPVIGENSYIMSKSSEAEDTAPVSTDLEKLSSPDTSIPKGPADGPSPLPPNGGVMAWLQVLGGFFALFNSWGIVNAFGSFQAYYSTVLLSNESQSAISWIGSIQGFIIVASGLFTGRLVDAGYARYMTIVGVFLVVFGFMMTSLSYSYYQVLLAQGIAVGIGANLLFISVLSVVPQYFTTRRAAALGLVVSGSSLGGVLYPIIVERLLIEVGYPWTCRIVGFIALATGSVTCLVMKPRIPARKSGPLIDVPSLTDAPFIVFSIGNFFGYISMFIPLFFIPSFTIYKGHSEATGIYMSSVINAASVFGRTVPNFVADKIGPFNTLIPAVGCVVIITFCWIAVESLGGIIAFCIFYGFFSGVFISLAAPCMVSLTKNLNILGTRIGMSFFITSFGLLCSGPVAGALLDRKNGAYLYAQIYCGIASILSFSCYMIARYLLRGTQVKVKV